MHSCNKGGRTLRRAATGLLLLVIICASPGHGADTGKRDGGEAESTTITADRMDAVRGENRVTFYGSVAVSQKEFSLKSEKVTVFYTAGGGEVSTIVAEGKVHIVQPEREATSEKAVYKRGERLLVLTGNPVVRQGKDRVGGVKITFHLDEDKSIVEGGEGRRVKAVIHPGESGALFEGRAKE